MPASPPVVAIVGGGPAGLMAAEVVATGGARVVVIEQRGSVGRKFLLAGRGGLNLTHSEGIEIFLTRYRDPAPQLVEAIRAFDPTALRAWADGLGAQTFVGTSGRVFPAALRAAPLLRAWLARLTELGVEFRLRERWTDWSQFDADAVVIAVGGASWPNTGSDGHWTSQFGADQVAALRASNAGFRVAWSETFRTKFAGTPIKDVRLQFGAESSRGDAMVTRTGLEGGPLYALSAPIRDATAGRDPATVYVDLRPDVPRDALARRLARRRAGDSVASWLRGAGLAPVAASLLREVTNNDVPTDPTTLAELIKAVPITVLGSQPLARAISTAGGLRFETLDEVFMLRDRPGCFVAGEMLDWDAPTGGYLLQACFSSGVAAARGALGWLNEGHSLR